MTITVEDILRGVGIGRVQSVGHMGVIPLVDEGDAQDDSFAPPDVGVGNSDYGHVNIHNEQDRPTIVPTGAGWMTKKLAQDHAIAGAVLIKAGQRLDINTAMCIESSQGGYLVKGTNDLIILPAALRAPALAMRQTAGYNKLWASIGQMHTTYTGSSTHRQHMNDFLKFFGKELDEFVAQFELVPKMIGAIILIGDRVVGIERAPTVDFWNMVWSPLVRICYGTLAVRARKILGDAVPQHRTSLHPVTKSLAGLAQALQAAKAESQRVIQESLDQVMSWQLQASGNAEGQMDDCEIVTLASADIAGQIVRRGLKVPYASLCRPYEPKHEGI